MDPVRDWGQLERYTGYFSVKASVPGACIGVIRNENKTLLVIEQVRFRSEGAPAELTLKPGVTGSPSAAQKVVAVSNKTLSMPSTASFLYGENITGLRWGRTAGRCYSRDGDAYRWLKKQFIIYPGDACSFHSNNINAVNHVEVEYTER